MGLRTPETRTGFWLASEEQISEMLARQIYQGVDIQLSGRNSLTLIRGIDAFDRSVDLGQVVLLTKLWSPSQ